MVNCESGIERGMYCCLYNSYLWFPKKSTSKPNHLHFEALAPPCVSREVPDYMDARRRLIDPQTPKSAARMVPALQLQWQFWDSMGAQQPPWLVFPKADAPIHPRYNWDWQGLPHRLQHNDNNACISSLILYFSHTHAHTLFLPLPLTCNKGAKQYHSIVNLQWW